MFYNVVTGDKDMFFDEQSITENLTSMNFSEKSNIAKMFYEYHKENRDESNKLYKDIIDIYDESINIIVNYLKKNNYVNPINVCSFISTLIYTGKLYPSNCVFDLVPDGTKLVQEIPGYEEMTILTGHGTHKNLAYFINDILLKLGVSSKICLMETTRLDEGTKTIKSSIISGYKINNIVPDKGDIDIISPKEFGIIFMNDAYYYLFEPTNMLLYSVKGTTAKLLKGTSTAKILPLSYMTFNGTSVSSMRMNFQMMDMYNFVPENETLEIYDRYFDGMLKVKNGEFDHHLSELHYLNNQYNFKNIKRISGDSLSDDEVRKMILK